jgi:hypothetical protein
MQTEPAPANGEATWDDAAKASAEAGEQAWETRREFDRELRCTLTEHEKAQHADRIAGLRLNRAAVEAQKKAALADFKQQLDDIEDDIDNLADEIRAGAGRMVECAEQSNDAGTIRIVRLDTAEVIDTRAMTAAERQGDLGLDDAPDGDDLDDEDDLEDDESDDAEG